MREVAISTFDNPYDPFDNFDEWFRYDNDKGYGSCQILANLTEVFEGMTPKEFNEEMERGIDSLLIADPANLYIKVVKEMPDLEEEFEEEIS